MTRQQQWQYNVDDMQLSSLHLQFNTTIKLLVLGIGEWRMRLASKSAGADDFPSFSLPIAFEILTCYMPIIHSTHSAFAGKHIRLLICRYFLVSFAQSTSSRRPFASVSCAPPSTSTPDNTNLHFLHWQPISNNNNSIYSLNIICHQLGNQ